MPEIFMPRLSDTMEEGTLSAWVKQTGERVEKGDILAEIETDKATMELEAYDAGVLERVLVQPGETVPIGTPIAVVGTGEGVADAPAGAAPAEAGADVSAEPAPVSPEPAAEPSTVEATQAQQPPGRIADLSSGPALAAPAPAAPDGERVKASPVARAMAREQGIDLASVEGSGPAGRVVRADVEAFLKGGGTPPPATATPTASPAAQAAPAASAPPPPASPTPQQQPSPAAVAPQADDEEVPLTSMRKVVARRLVESMQSAPHFYLTTVVNAAPLSAFRSDLNATLADSGVKVSVNDLVVKACATVLQQHPDVNVSWAGDKILRHKRIHVGLAVALGGGLIVPVVRDTNTKTVSQVSQEAKALIAKARAGKLSLEEFSGGTFTVSNLGMFGIDQFTAVINPPEAAILAVGATTEEAVVTDGQVVAGQRMKLTLSIDHRALDGATGAAFLKDLKAILEEPLRILA